MTKPYTSINIIVADDHEMVREGLQIMISKIEGIEIIEEAANGEELIRLTRQHRPDVVLVDIKMPRCNGIEATRVIKSEFPHIGIVALSSFDDESLILDMLRAGAKGYLLKNASKEEITAAVHAAYRDEAYYCREINLKLAQMIARGGRHPLTSPSEIFTERELQIIELICDGLSSKEIASALNLKRRTVERYRDNIMDKMDVKNAAGVVMYAVSNRLFERSGKGDEATSTE